MCCLKSPMKCAAAMVSYVKSGVLSSERQQFKLHVPWKYLPDIFSVVSSDLAQCWRRMWKCAIVPYKNIRSSINIGLCAVFWAVIEPWAHEVIVPKQSWCNAVLSLESGRKGVHFMYHIVCCLGKDNYQIALLTRLELFVWKLLLVDSYMHSGFDSW